MYNVYYALKIYALAEVEKFMDTKSFNIELKKIILAHLQHSAPIHTIIEELLDNLLTLSMSAHAKDDALNTASEYILAYLQIGFSYLEHRVIFDTVLTQAGYNTEQISELQAKNKVILLNRPQLRSIIGRWPASPYNSHTITEAIDDIIVKATNDNYGTYHYFTARKGGKYTALYQLTVSPGYILFCDVLCNRYYQLLKK